MTFQDLIDAEPDHPLLPLPTAEELDVLLKRHGFEETFRRWEALRLHRRQTIAAAAKDPIRCAPRPKVWRIARRLLMKQRTKILVLLGGNRSTKSFFAAYLLMETALRITAVEVAQNEGVTFLVTSETEDSSKETAQKIVWSLLPEEIRKLNGRRDHTSFVHYSIKNGFTDNVLVLPSGVKIQFASYQQDPGAWEGRELGLKHRRALAWWADENMPLPWYLMFKRRGQYRPGFGVWSFTPINGITNTIKEAVGEGRVLKTRVARILSQEQVLVPGLRRGRVPFIQDGSDDTIRVIYFHSDLTPFKSGGRRYSDLVADLVKDKTKTYILAVYYGFTVDVAGRAWPKYRRQSHMVAENQLPAIGTNFLFIDPAGGRSWFMVWVRVAPGNPRKAWIYRDWPDKRRHGEWAVPTTRQLGPDGRRGRDGDAGPAQRNPGWGIASYKNAILSAETIEMRLAEDGTWVDLDPYRRSRLDDAMRQAGERPKAETISRSGIITSRWDHAQVTAARERMKGPVREEIFMRFIDPRAAGQPHAAEKGGVTLITLFADEQSEGGIVAPSMELVPAYSGRDVDEGIRAVNDLLDYDEFSPLVPMLNEPKLKISERCEQVDWVMTNYTGMGSETDGAKDVADTLRYVALADDLQYMDPKNTKARPGWSY